MFQALTGRPPLLGKSALETISMQQAVKPPTLADVAPQVEFPYALERIVAKLLAKSPEHRYDSLADLARELLYLERGDTAARNRTSGDEHNEHPEVSDIFARTVGDTNWGVQKNGGVLIAALVIALGLVVAAAFFIIQYRRAAAPPAVAVELENQSDLTTSTATMFIDSVTQDRKPDGSLIENDMSAADLKKIEEFLNSHHEPYAHREIHGGRKQIVYNFPPNFSLGTYTLRYKSRPAVTGDASGRVVTAVDTSLKLETGAEVKAEPRLLGRFGPYDLDWLELKGMTAHRKDLEPQLARLIALRVLVLCDSKIDDRDLAWMEKISGLHSLNLLRTKVSASALAKSPLLNRVSDLAVGNMTGIQPLLHALVKAQVVHRLDVSHTPLKPVDLDTIAKMNSLMHLNIASNELKDSDLLKLKDVQSLKELDLHDCRLLTRDVYDLLLQFKDLKVLKMSLPIVDEQKDKELKLAFSGIKLPNLSWPGRFLQS